jgi:divalent metal cation (Fe/Co/Zn/Cd) transporter
MKQRRFKTFRGYKENGFFNKFLEYTNAVLRVHLNLRTFTTLTTSARSVNENTHVARPRDNSLVPEFIQIQVPGTIERAGPGSRRPLTVVLWLQGITLAWMLVECGVSLYAAETAHSPALLAFGSDSLVELFSATVVLLQFLPRFPLSPKRASRAAGFLLFALAGIAAAIAIAALVLHMQPETSQIGIGITTAALIAMPVLAYLKNREARRANNLALRADAVQSATCAYLAGVTLAGLMVNAVFGLAWFDSLAALMAVPLLLKEGVAAWRGGSCGCC